MPPPRRAAANERSITLLLDVDPTELRMGIFGSFNAWPSGDQELIRLLFKVATRMHEMTVNHQVSYPTNLNLAPNDVPPPYAPPTSAEKEVMYSGTDTAMTACREGISTIMTARYTKDKCTNAQKPSAQHSELQRAASMLLATLLEACQEDARFSHLKDMHYVKEDRLAYNVITLDMCDNVWQIPGVRLFFDIIDTATKQKLTATTNAAALFDVPDPWSSHSDHRTKIAPALRALADAKLLTALELIAHLEAPSITNFINTCANNNDIPASYREAYQLGANDLSDRLTLDPTPLSMETMNKVTEKIRRVLDDKKLAPACKPPATTKLARFETKTASSSKAPFAPRSGRDSRRGNGPLRGGLRGGGDRRVPRDPTTIQCNTCFQFGHVWLTCPKGNKEMQKKELACRAERDSAKSARNATRGLRRVKR
jgi:hypothetical protein